MNIFVLTGAGISAESGLATFRGEGGLWEGHRIEDVCTPDALSKNRKLVHRFYDERRSSLKLVKPNAAHEALARLERHWTNQNKGDFLLVTQNVDDLHERAGSHNLIHMHGELKSALCDDCGARTPWHLPLGEFERCGFCKRGYLRPDIVFFGEMPYQMERIHEALRTCDLFLAVGTSGTVYPASQFVMFAKDAGAAAHQFNTELADGSHRFDTCHVGEASETLPKFVKEMTGNKTAGWDLTPEQKAAFIKEMEECGAHTTFYCSGMVEYLTSAGLDAEEMPDGSMRLYDQIIKLTQPEWGEPGIYAPNVLSAAIDAHGLDIATGMLGRGFGHRDRLEKLKEVWNDSVESEK